jgi:hypothetical protein
MFIAVLFTTAKIWKQPRIHSQVNSSFTTDEWVKKM